MIKRTLKSGASVALFSAAGFVVLNAILNMDVTNVASAAATCFLTGFLHEALWG